MESLISTPHWFVLNFVPCPSCNAALTPNPTEGEWNNVFCAECEFACRFVTAHNSPESKHLATRKADLENFLGRKKAFPPLIIHFTWEAAGSTRQQVEFFPFIAYRFLTDGTKEFSDMTNGTPLNAKIFANMFALPSVTLYETPSDDELVDFILRNWDLPITTARIQRELQYDLGRALTIRSMAADKLEAKGIVVDEDDFDVS